MLGHVSPEIGLLCLLLEVEANKLAPQEDRGSSSAYGVDQECDKERRVDGIQDPREGYEINARIQYRHRESQGCVCELPAPHQTGNMRELLYSFLKYGMCQMLALYMPHVQRIVGDQHYQTVDRTAHLTSEDIR